MLEIISVRKLQKGKFLITFDNGISLPLYKKDCPGLCFEEGQFLDQETYDDLINQTLRLRVQKRVLYLLEKMDRTEYQLRDKLRQNHYPDLLIDHGIAYAKSYHYIDDLRYIETYIRQSKDKKSKQRIKMDLIQKGCSKELIEEAFENVLSWNEEIQIQNLLHKKKYNHEEAEDNEKRKIYQYLLRKGYKSEDILRCMRVSE